MTPEQIAADIERGIQIRQEIDALQAELKAINARLEAAGLEGEQVPLQDENREGKQFIARGRSMVVPVRFESDLIAGSFDPDSAMHTACKAAAGDKFERFFKEVRKFERIAKDGEAFRKLAREILDPRAFAALIQAATQRNKAGIAKSRTVVAWDDAKPLEAVAS